MADDQLSRWEHVLVRLPPGVHHSAEYKAFNPAEELPALQVVDSDGKEVDKAFGALAIMKYICRARKLKDSWYPTSAERDQRLLDKMDVYLEWHHEHLRTAVVRYIYDTYFQKAMAGVVAGPSELRLCKEPLTTALAQVNARWMASREGKYLFGDELSIADLALAAEMT